MKENIALRVIEILVLGGILAAFLAPLFVPSIPQNTINRSVASQ